MALCIPGAVQTNRKREGVTRRIWNDTVETNKHKESYSSDGTVQAKKQTIHIFDKPYRAVFEKVFIFKGHII